jgi:enamine deaminase RidA (YjgF/YER057c/UK114 family)
MRLAATLLFAFLPCSTLAAQGGSRFINPPSLTKATGYTHVVVAPDGRTVYIAGQVAFDSTGQLVGGSDFKAQADQVYQNLRKALASVGGSLEDITKTTTYITDVKNVPLLRDVRMKYLPKRPPANTLLVVASLARAELLIEIEAIAVLSNVVRHTGE